MHFNIYLCINIKYTYKNCLQCSNMHWILFCSGYGLWFNMTLFRQPSTFSQGVWNTSWHFCHIFGISLDLWKGLNKSCRFWTGRCGWVSVLGHRSYFLPALNSAYWGEGKGVVACEEPEICKTWCWAASLESWWWLVVWTRCPYPYLIGIKTIKLRKQRLSLTSN